MAWTAPRTWVTGEVETAAIFNTHVRDNLLAIGSAWLTYTPTWTSTGTAPALGNGTITGRYVTYGKTLAACEVILTLGSTSTVGTGGYSFSLPLTLLNGTLGLAAGSATFYDSSAATVFTRIAVRNSTTTVALFDMAGTRVSATAPVVPAVGDIMTFTCVPLELA